MKVPLSAQNVIRIFLMNRVLLPTWGENILILSRVWTLNLHINVGVTKNCRVVTVTRNLTIVMISLTTTSGSINSPFVIGFVFEFISLYGSIHMKPFMCNHCGQKFGSQFALTLHIRYYLFTFVHCCLHTFAFMIFTLTLPKSPHRQKTWHVHPHQEVKKLLLKYQLTFIMNTFFLTWNRKRGRKTRRRLH